MPSLYKAKEASTGVKIAPRQGLNLLGTTIEILDFSFVVVGFPTRHFAGNTERGGSNQVGVAQVISIVPFVTENKRRENRMLSRRRLY